MRLKTAFLAALLLGCRDVGDVRLGAVLSPDGADGAMLAVSDISRLGLLPGHTLSLRSIPDGVTAMPAITAAETLSDDPSVVGVVGHSNSASTLSASTIYNEQHLSHIAPTSTVALLDARGPYSFRMVGSDSHQAQFLARSIANRPNVRVAIQFVNDDYGRGIHESLEGLLRSWGHLIVYEAPYSEGTSFGDPEANARALARNRPDVLFWLGRSMELSRVLPFLRRSLPNLIVIGSDGLNGPTEGGGIDTVFAGVAYVVLAPTNSKSRELEELDRRFQTRFHYPLSTQARLAYEAVMLYSDAIRTVGTDREKIRDYLASLGRTRPPHKGVTTEIQFDASGSAGSLYLLMKFGLDGKSRSAAVPLQ